MSAPTPWSGPTADHPPLLVGRAREQAWLSHHLAAALAGQGSLVLIGGEAGIGKTALAETLGREAAAQGALVLTGRCYDLTATPPYGPWLDLLAAYSPAADLPPLPAILSRGGIGEVASPEALFVQARDFLAAVAARRPLVLILDDLHWADPASLELLRYLARQRTTAPLFLVTYRVEELTRGHPLYGLLPTLVREAYAARLDLERLGDDAVRSLVRARYPLPEADEARLAAYLQDRAEGNPFFIGELLRMLEKDALHHLSDGGWALGDLSWAGVPLLLRQVIEARVARLGEDARGLLTVAAMIGQEVPLALWAKVSGIGEEALLDVVERAVEAHLLVETPEGTRARFVHALIREVLYEGVLPSRRRIWHRRVAEALMTTPSPDPDAVAYHFRQAGATGRLVDGGGAL